MGICLWSPPLDEMGNSVRGVKFCEEFAKYYTFHKVNAEGFRRVKRIYQVSGYWLIRA